MKNRKQIYILGKALLFAIVLLSMMPINAKAQQQAEVANTLSGTKLIGKWTVGGSFHTGALMNHHNYMAILSEKKPWIIEVFAAKKTYGQRDWHSSFGYPDIGLKLTIMDVGSPTYVGKSYSIHPYMKFYLLRSRRFRPSITAAAGPVYVEKIFDRKENYKNTAIGSHVNAFLQLQADLNVRITYRAYIFGGLSLSHISNGSFKKPNAGVNVMTARVGAGYTFGEINGWTLRKEEVESIGGRMAKIEDAKWNYRAILSGGIKEISPIGGDKYGVGSLSFEVSKKHRTHTRFNGSLDVFYDGSDYDALIYENSYSSDNLSKLQTAKLGLAAGYELLFGRVSTNFQVGAYLYAKQTVEGFCYQRFTIRYMLTNHVGVQFGLKSHMGVADYIELGCIYRIK